MFSVTYFLLVHNATHAKTNHGIYYHPQSPQILSLRDINDMSLIIQSVMKS